MKFILKIFLSFGFLPFLCCLNESKKLKKSNFWIDEQEAYWNGLLEKNKKWYSSNEAIEIANNILIYQHFSGGWPKNIDYKIAPSKIDVIVLKLSNFLKKYPSTYHATIDNNSTYSQMRFLAKIYNNTGFNRFKMGFLAGLDYLLLAQNENGGWPQYFPYKGGYKNNITFNDDAMIGVMQILKEVSELKFSFVDDLRINKSVKAIEKGLELILRTQIISGGKLTIWCSQYDPSNLHPSRARSFEPIALSARESVKIIQYLMNVSNPDTVIIKAIESAITWYKEVAIEGLRIVRIKDMNFLENYDIQIIINPDDRLKPLNWARYYEIDTNVPIFSGRDGIVKYSMSDIEHERRINYEWYGDWANDLIFDHHSNWSANLKNFQN